MSSYSLRGFEEFFTDSDREIMSRMREIYNYDLQINQAQWVQGSIDDRFYAGDQTLWNEIYSSIPVYQRKQISFNKIKRIINMISGHERRNRKSLITIPIEGSDQLTSDQFSKTLVWTNNRADSAHVISDAFEGSLITGMNLLSVWMDYREDPFSGDMRIENYGYNGYMIDPYFKKMDLSDCNYIWTRKFLSKKQIVSLMPEHEKEIMPMTRGETKDGYFNFLPQNYIYTNKDLLPYDEFWYLDYRDATILVDSINEESMEWNGPEENLRLFLKKYPQLKKQKIQKQTCKLAIVVNNHLMYHGKNPFKIDKYPFIPVIAYYQPELPYYEWRVQGVVRGLRDSQFLLNRRQQILLDILESQVNSGLKVMEGSLIDSKDAFKTGQGQVYYIKKDAPYGMDSIQKIPPADVPASMFQVIQQMDQNMTDISGVNEELLGSAEDDKAGILAMLRQGAGLTTLQLLFDNLDCSMKALGRLELDLIQANFTSAKVARITEQQPTDQFYNKSFQKYDCEVIEGTNTPTQRLNAFKQALYLRELGIPITSKFLLEMSSLQNKAELIKDVMEQEQQQAQQQQQMAQIQMAELKARAQLAEARSFADDGLGAERYARIPENRALAIERIAAAKKDQDLAELHKIEALKTLSEMDLSQFEKAISIYKSLQEKPLEKEEQQLEKIAIKSNELNESK